MVGKVYNTLKSLSDLRLGVHRLDVSLSAAASYLRLSGEPTYRADIRNMSVGLKKSNCYSLFIHAQAPSKAYARIATVFYHGINVTLISLDDELFGRWQPGIHLCVPS